MSDPRDFLLNTDYEMDKIAYFKSGDFTSELEFAHGLGFTPLVFGVWSTDENFANSNTLGNAAVDDYVGTPPLNAYVVVRGNNIRIRARGENKDTTKIYYRIYAFEPPDANENAPHTSEHAEKFVLNTDYNYRKLKDSGIFTQNGEEYSHNLGYYPHVMAWIKYRPDFQNGMLEPFTWASEFTGAYITVTTDKIKATFPDTWVEKIYWRIYYDET
jgi:hypothetical protein